MRLVLLAAVAACAISAPLMAQPVQTAKVATPAAVKEPFERAPAEEAVAELAKQLEDSFVFPDVGNAYAKMLRANLASGKYASFASKQAFADAVTDDLQAIQKDGHLRVHVVPPEARSGPKDDKGNGKPPTINGVTKSGWLADGVAYIDFSVFPGNEETLAPVRAFLDSHKGAKTLIIDARHHRGGGLAEMDLLFAQLFDKPVILVDMDTRVAVEKRHGSPVAGHPTLREIKGPDGVVRREHFVVPAAAHPSLARTKVYLLTSKRTASAAEHLSMSLQRTRRATLVGETTAGAGHYGGMLPLDKAVTYSAFIPVGRTFDPDTNKGWEGTGVKPDVAVPADKALDEALRLAGVKATGEAALASLK
jgi:hypothetical protein